VIAILEKDAFTGEGCLGGQSLRITTASALTECEVMRIEKDAIVSILHKELGFLELFVTHLLVRNIRVEADLVDQLFDSSEKRLARALLLLANFGKEGRPEPIITSSSSADFKFPFTACFVHCLNMYSARVTTFFLPLSFTVTGALTTPSMILLALQGRAAPRPFGLWFCPGLNRVATGGFP
jgi:hypothetical protein